MKLYRLALGSLFLVTSQGAAAQHVDECILAGQAFNQAMKAEAYRVAFNENLAPIGVPFYRLPKSWQATVLSDIETMKVYAAKEATQLMEIDVPKWNQQKVSGMTMARGILSKAFGDSDYYLLRCLKNPERFSTAE